MLARSRAEFETVPDFTVAVEEEFALLDPETLDLVNRFEELQDAARGSELEPHLVGELIASEIEVRTGRCDSFADAAALLGERRQQLRAVAEPRGILLGATGTHPWSPWQEQRIIDTPHYRRNDEVLRYVVWRNNSFGQHVHVGINGPDRAIRVCSALRNYLPSCSRSRGARRSSRESSRTSTRRAPRSSRGCSRGAGSLTRSRAGTSGRPTSASSTRPARSPSTRSSGGASGRISHSRPSRSGSATRSPTSASRGRSRRSATR